jgi:S1-C subfamily serine protease
LVNEWGEVVGINTLMRKSANSIGFAVPVNRAKVGLDFCSFGCSGSPRSVPSGNVVFDDD